MQHGASHVSFSSLPREIRLQILSYTDLVRRCDFHWRGQVPGYVVPVWSGKILLPPHSSRVRVALRYGYQLGSDEVKCGPDVAIPFPAALFTVSRAMYEDASEIFWSMNRFVIANDMRAGQKWLSSLKEQDVRKIRKLDVMPVSDGSPLLFGLGSDHQQDDEIPTVKEWNDLMETIAERCCVHRLWLSIDIRHPDVADRVIRELDNIEEVFTGLWLTREIARFHARLRQIYRRIVHSTERAFRNQKPAKFHMFMSWGLAGEGMAERHVMGPDYDSRAEGKLAPYGRDVRNPHLPVLDTDRKHVRCYQAWGLDDFDLDGALGTSDLWETARSI